jgi:leucyl aminopeptidase (aminopeptidase T)
LIGLPNSLEAMSEELDKAVRAVVQDCLGVGRGEEVLVICNPATRVLGERLQAEAAAAGGDAVLAVIAERPSHAAEPPGSIAAAMAAADVVLAPTVQSLSHTAARRAATEAGVRVATLPGVTEEMLARVMSADIEGLRRKGTAVAAELDRGTEARISCANGSDLRLGLEGRRAIADAGELTAPGAFGNLPCGEGFIAPLEGSAEGMLVVDGSIATIGTLGEPVRLTVSGGHLTEASGEHGSELMGLLTVHGEDGTNVAELGIGTNEKAILTGEVLEDEKILGTAHIAFGASAAIGGTVQVPVHLDCVVTKPTVEVDGRAIVRDGKLLVGDG